MNRKVDALPSYMRAQLDEMIVTSIRGRTLTFDEVVTVVHSKRGRCFGKEEIREAVLDTVCTNTKIKYSI